MVTLQRTDKNRNGENLNVLRGTMEYVEKKVLQESCLVNSSKHHLAFGHRLRAVVGPLADHNNLRN